MALNMHGMHACMYICVHCIHFKSSLSLLAPSLTYANTQIHTDTHTHTHVHTQTHPIS